MSRRPSAEREDELEQRMRALLAEHRRILLKPEILAQTYYLRMIHELLLLFMEVALEE